MKKIIYLLLLLLAPVMAQAEGVSGKIAADSAYVNGDYKAAIEAYEAVLADEGEAADVYYNLGNAYYKSDNIGKAIVNYERALLLNPSDEDVAFNLELARSKTVDKVATVHKFFLMEWLEAIINLMGMQTWCIVGVVFFLLMLLTALVYLFGKSILLRKISFFTALFALFATVFANMSAYHQYYYQTNRAEAIVMQPSVTAKSTPGESGTDLFVIHEGRKVTIVDDSMQGWKEIELEDGNIGWVPASVIERI